MVIDEKILLKAVKKAYSSEGYIVARRAGDGALLLQAHGWAVEITWENVPDKLIGLIAEHIRDLLKPGEAFGARKGEDPGVVFMDTVQKMPDAEESVSAVKQTQLCWADNEIWQICLSERCVMVPCARAEMMLGYGRAVKWADSGLYLEGKASKIYVMPKALLAESVEQNALDALSQHKWA